MDDTIDTHIIYDIPNDDSDYVDMEFNNNYLTGYLPPSTIDHDYTQVEVQDVMIQTDDVQSCIPKCNLIVVLIILMLCILTVEIYTCIKVESIKKPVDEHEHLSSITVHGKDYLIIDYDSYSYFLNQIDLYIKGSKRDCIAACLERVDTVTSSKNSFTTITPTSKPLDPWPIIVDGERYTLYDGQLY
nr:putative TM protein [Paramyxoviridae sp.]